MMNEGFDMVGKKAVTDGEGVTADGGLETAEDLPVFINNIVFCRNPQILKDKETCMNMSTLIQHENLLDVKQLVKSQSPHVESASEDVIKKRKV